MQRGKNQKSLNVLLLKSCGHAALPARVFPGVCCSLNIGAARSRRGSLFCGDERRSISVRARFCLRQIAREVRSELTHRLVQALDVVQAGRAAMLSSGDIGDRSLCETIADKAIAKLGSIDILAIQAFSKTKSTNGTRQSELHSLLPD
jgi:hypothetical protein